MVALRTDPLALAEMARGRMRRKIPDLAQALTGTFDAHHAQLAKSMLQAKTVERLLAALGPRERAALSRVQEYGGSIPGAAQRPVAEAGV